MTRRVRWRIVAIGIAILTTGIAVASEPGSDQPVSWSFSDDSVGAGPQGWEVLSGRWEVRTESEGMNRVLTQLAPPLPGATLAAILAPVPPARDVRIGVRFKSTGAGVRETMGLLLRWQGPAAMLTVRLDGTPGWIWLDRIQNGLRSARAGYVIPSIRDGEWNSLRIVARQEWLMLFFNGKFLGGVRDDDPAPGRVGLLAGPDGGLSLDDVVIETSSDTSESG